MNDAGAEVAKTFLEKLVQTHPSTWLAFLAIIGLFVLILLLLFWGGFLIARWVVKEKQKQIDELAKENHLYRTRYLVVHDRQKGITKADLGQ